jgi:hypothetical protein
MRRVFEYSAVVSNGGKRSGEASIVFAKAVCMRLVR